MCFRRGLTLTRTESLTSAIVPALTGARYCPRLIDGSKQSYSWQAYQVKRQYCWRVTILITSIFAKPLPKISWTTTSESSLRSTRSTMCLTRRQHRSYFSSRGLSNISAKPQCGSTRRPRVSPNLCCGTTQDMDSTTYNHSSIAQSGCEGISALDQLVQSCERV